MAKRVTYHVIAYGERTRPRLRNFREQKIPKQNSSQS